MFKVFKVLKNLRLTNDFLIQFLIRISKKSLLLQGVEYKFIEQKMKKQKMLKKYFGPRTWVHKKTFGHQVAYPTLFENSYELTEKKKN